MGLFDIFGKKSDTSDSKYEIDDMSYIADMKHVQSGDWHQYDVKLAARGYGWADIISWADYMAGADLAHISKVSRAEIVGAEEKDILDDYRNAGSFKGSPVVREEGGVLSVGGMSKAVGGPVQVIWFNQSQYLRFFTTTGNEDLMTRYVETMIRRSFNTPDALKLARPVEA